MKVTHSTVASSYHWVRSEPVGQHHPLPVLVELVIVLLGPACVGPQPQPVCPGIRPELRSLISL